MEKELFRNNFKEAIQKSIDFAQEYIKEELPNNFIVDLYMVDSRDTHKSEREGFYSDFEEIIAKLYKDGNVPRWVNLNVKSIKDNESVIRCEYSNTFIDDMSQLLHQKEGLPPFHILSPHIPPSHYDFEQDKIKEGKFSIKDLPTE